MMFLEKSRYFGQNTIDAVAKDGRTVRAITLRKLPMIKSQSTVVKDDDRLDIIAQRNYEDPTLFWHVADANTELKANDLVEESGREIEIPE